MSENLGVISPHEDLRESNQKTILKNYYKNKEQLFFKKIKQFFKSVILLS